MTDVGLDINTLIPTPDSWTSVDQLSIGDELFSSNGEICQVIGISNTAAQDCYKLNFCHGGEIICGAGQGWDTLNNSDRVSNSKKVIRSRKDRINNKWTIRPLRTPSIKRTDEIALLIKYKNRTNHSVNLITPFLLKDKELPIDPYLLGVWLGDGTSRSGNITSDDLEIIDEFVILGYTIKSFNEDYKYDARGLKGQLQGLDLIQNKHIPADYLRASFRQRLSLLQGLMDTDGNIGKKDQGSCEFNTTSVKLRDGVVELIRTLGIPICINEREAYLYGKYISQNYRFEFMSRHPVFRLMRKLEKQKMRGLRFNHMFIESGEKINNVPIRCIKTNSKTGLFVCGKDMIATVG